MTISQIIGIIVAGIGGSAVLLAAVAWLVRSIISQVLAKGLEAYRIELSKQANLEVERARYEFQRVSFEYEIRFRHLHEKRALVVAELYSLLVVAIKAVANFLQPIEWFNQHDRDTKFDESVDTLKTFFKYFDQNRLWLPAELANNAQILADKLSKWLNDYTIWNSMPNSEVANQQKHETILKGWENINSEISILKDALEKEFRQLLQTAKVG